MLNAKYQAAPSWCPSSILLLICLVLSGTLSAHECDECVDYVVRHKTHIEGHPVFGEWVLIEQQCLPPDDERIFKVCSDGTVTSDFLLNLEIQSRCTYENINPKVEFVDENNEVIMDPTPEEEGVIDVVSMSEDHTQFEYTHPTNPPPASEKYRDVRIRLSDSIVEGDMYGQFGILIMRVYRPPVVMVHGLWA